MKSYLCDLMVSPDIILVAPFADISRFASTSKRNSSFFCVSSGDPHKNIKNLILAWVILSKEAHYPTLYLTLSKTIYPKLVGWLEEMVIRYELKIQNFGVIDSVKVSEIYQSGSALIFPSFSESLGLPLIEAREAGVDIIAPELDYVRDVVEPVQTFDPNSPVSISRAVKRYLGIDYQLVKLWDVPKLSKELFGAVH